MQEIIPPHKITYEGGLADNHFINSEDLSASILGASKISSSIAHYIFLGRVPRSNSKKIYQCVTRPPAQGSYEWLQYVVPIVPVVIEHSGGIKTGATFLFELFWEQLVSIWTNNQDKSFKVMTDTLLELSKAHDQTMLEALKVQAMVADGAMRNIVDVSRDAMDRCERMVDSLRKDLPELAKSQKTNALNYIQPIGNSCITVNNNFYSGNNLLIDSGKAEIIRSDQPDEIGEEDRFKCHRITELNILNGHCILEISGYEDPVTGQISDPVLEQKKNIYTVALDEHKPLLITGKPILRDGELYKIHISNASQL